MKSFATPGSLQSSAVLALTLATGCLAGIDDSEDMLGRADEAMAEAQFELAAGIPSCPVIGATVNPDPCPFGSCGLATISPSCTDSTCFSVQVFYENTGEPCFGSAGLTVAKNAIRTGYSVPVTAAGEFFVEFDINDEARPLELTACPINANAGCVSRFLD
jgi:hypothetical protein